MSELKRSISKLQSDGEHFKQSLWFFIDNWAPYSEKTLKDKMNDLLDEIDGIESEFEDKP